MKKNALGVFVLVGFAVSVSCGAGEARAAAPVIINEIMYDLKDLSDTNHEWIELYNSGSTSVSLQGWKFVDSSSHVLNAPPANGGQGSLLIEPNGYVILSGDAATYLADHPGYSGTVIDTVMSLNNAGATLTIVDSSGSVVDIIIYTSDLGGNSDGKALSRLGPDILTPKLPTPGYENETVEAESDGTDENAPPETEAISGGAAPPPPTRIEIKPKNIPYDIKMTIPTKLTVGVPIPFSAKATGTLGEELYSGIYIWSFGDGESTIRNDKNEFTYTYAYPGEYVVHLEYYVYSNQEKPLAVARKTVKIMPSMLSITKINNDGSIQISNLGSQEVNLKGWTVSHGVAKYTFKNHIIILPKDAITLKPSLINLVANNSIPRLADPSGVEMPLVKPPEVQIKSTATKIIASKSSTTVAEMVKPAVEKNTVSKEKQISQPSRKLLVIAGLGSFICIAILSALFLKTKKRESDPLSTFES